MNSLVKKVEDLTKNIEKLETMVFKDEVSWEDVNLLQWKIGESKYISGSLNTKIFEKNNIIIFNTVLPPLCIFNKHYHKKFTENNFIMSGIYEDANGQHGKGCWITYKNGVIHKVANPSPIEDLDIIVIFTKS
jgi:hypothetical protein